MNLEVSVMPSNNYYSEPVSKQRESTLGQYFQLSGAWIRENLKRFWAIPALGMLFYFFTFLFPLFVEDVYQNTESYLRDISRFQNAGLVLYSVLFPLIASVALNRYLYSSGSVNTMHSLPVTKGRLWLSNLISGLIMVWLPGIITFAALILGYAKYGYSAGIAASLGKLLLCSAFYLTLFNLAAMLTGNVPVHIIASGFISALPAAVVLMIIGLCQTMVYGYTTRGDWDGVMLATFFPPIAAAINDTGVLTASLDGWYYIIAAVMAIAFYFAGAYLYSRRKLERAGDSFAFTFAQVIFVSCITVAGALILGALFWSIWGGAFPWNIGMPAGGIIAFVIAKMVGVKSLRIFSRRSAVHFSLTFALLLALLGIFEFGAFGYEERIPAVSEVEEVDFQSWNIVPYYSVVGNNNFITMKDPETLEAINALHKLLVKDSPLITEDYDYYQSSFGLTLNYYLKNGKYMTRYYWVPHSVLEGSGILEQIVMSGEYQKAMGIENWIGDAKIEDLSINHWTYHYNSSVTLGSAEYQSFLNALQADRDKIDWVSLIGQENDDSPLFHMSLSIDRNPEMDTYAYDYADVGILEDYTNTIQWLKDKGYYDILTASNEIYRGNN
jgi:ABC-2 type transport system permease protein